MCNQGNSCWIIICVIILFLFCGNGCGCGCNNKCGCNPYRMGGFYTGEKPRLPAGGKLCEALLC